MKRRLTTVIVFLALGAIVNVAVAWGCALLSMESWRATAISHEHESLITYPSWEEPRNEGYTYSVTSRYWKADSLVVGWPTHSVEAKLPESRPSQWPKARPLMKHIIYASRPVWPTFEINTIFYAAILWGVTAALAKFKSTLRRRRGLCAKCAYPIGVSPVCTECGAAVARKAQA